jgi:hypothetical protein
VADNRASALRYLTRKGLTPAQAAGVVGSLMQESGLRTKAKNPSSGALGIGQWLGGRKTNLLNSGKSGGLQGQLDFLWSELQGPERAALTRLRGAHTVPDAASAFTWGFERPGKAEANMPNRIRQGRAALGLVGDPHADPGDSDEAEPPAQRYRTTTTSTPGVDNRAARAQLILSFLNTKKADPVDFAVQARGLRDVAPTSETTRTPIASPRAPSAARPSSPSRSSGVNGSKVLELIFNDGGKGFGIKDGADVDGGSVFSGVWAGHADHVHVAAGPKTVVSLGKIAQSRFGLHVGENSHFGGVTPVHVPGSYHNKDEAIDVSGDPRKMAAFARYVRTYNRQR